MVERIVRFLREIGLRVSIGEIGEATFLPGMRIVRGGLQVDPVQLRYPGDLLHEAGHLAVMPAERRSQADGEVGGDGGEEMAAIAWSYAATVHLGIDAAVVFHKDGYKGGSSALLENFAAGRYVGVPMLVWLGMTAAAEYPRMRRWLVDGSGGDQ
jgi:hypothetical protein